MARRSLSLRWAIVLLDNSFSATEVPASPFFEYVAPIAAIDSNNTGLASVDRKVERRMMGSVSWKYPK
jgi:hypothetical protein